MILSMSGNLIAWAILLLAIAVVLFFAEMFIPSGGLIGLFAAAAAVAGVVLLFKVDTTIGLIGALVCVAGLPFLFMVALKIWPNTPIARMLTLRNPPRADGAEAGDTPVRDPHAPDPLIGVQGKALTDLRPVGACLIDGRRTECLAETGVIRAGTAVRVVAVDGTQIKVKEIAEA